MVCAVLSGSTEQERRAACRASTRARARDAVTSGKRLDATQAVTLAENAGYASRPAINSSGPIGNSSSRPVLAERSMAMVSMRLRWPSAAVACGVSFLL